MVRVRAKVRVKVKLGLRLGSFMRNLMYMKYDVTHILTSL